MPKGPLLNKLSKKFTTRDSLGIESIVSKMEAETCPIVNTVTPRAFYWPFLIWIYYDFYENSGIKPQNKEKFNEYVKKTGLFLCSCNSFDR